MDNPRAIPESHPLHRLFRGLTEYTFMNELGIGDPSLVGYVAELLASFVPSHGVWHLRDAQGTQLFEVTAMVAEAEAAGDAARRRECHRHVGDFTLFWTGVYPEALARLQGGLFRRADQLSAPGQAVLSSGERLERGQRSRDDLPPLERAVRAMRRGSLARAPGMGEDRARRAFAGRRFSPCGCLRHRPGLHFRRAGMGLEDPSGVAF